MESLSYALIPGAGLGLAVRGNVTAAGSRP